MWLRVDDNFADHPKVAALSDGAFRLHVRALCYCARHLTDGCVPKTFTRSRAVSELTRVKLWSRTRAGWLIKDFLEYNPSRGAVEERRRVASEKGRRGADSRWHGSSHSGTHVRQNGPDPYPVLEPKEPPATPGDSVEEPWFQRFQSGELAGISDDHLHLLRRLYLWDQRWGDLTLGGYLKIRQKHGSAIMTMALQHAWEDKPTISSGPYPLLEVIAQTIRAGQS